MSSIEGGGEAPGHTHEREYEVPAVSEDGLEKLLSRAANSMQLEEFAGSDIRISTDGGYGDIYVLDLVLPRETGSWREIVELRKRQLPPIDDSNGM